VHRLRPGDRGRRRAGLTAWLLVRGRGERPLPAVIDPEEIRRHSSSKRPSVEPGELAVLYAAVWQAIYAVVEITGVPEHDPARTRWSWRFPIRPLVAVRDLHDAPPVEAAGIFPQSLWRHSHIRLSEDQFEAARELVEAAALGQKQHWPLAPGEL
jgi:hypothetical protein